MIERMIKRFEKLTNMTLKQYLKGVKWTFIIGSIVILLNLIFLAVTSLLNPSAPKDVYVLKGNLVPAFESVVGERHGDLWRDEENEIAYAFNRTETSTADAKKYVQSLQDEGGYVLISETPPNEYPQFASLIKEAVQAQHSIGISITYPHDNQEEQDIFIGIKLWDVEYNETLTRFRETQRSSLE